VLEIFQSGGLLMWPLLLCSIIALAIIAERFWTLQKRNVAPANLLQQVLDHEKANRVSDDLLKLLVKSSPLGRLFAVGLLNRDHGREIMKEAIEEEGSLVVHELDRYLNTLGTIAAITPLLGLLGTVIGMIQVFTSITPEVMTQGIGDPTVLAAGISKALITTAAGLSIGIPALMFHRYFKGKVHALTVAMEQQSVKLVEIIQGDREYSVSG
jgi:biopolymer transport protein ExbB